MTVDAGFAYLNGKSVKGKEVVHKADGSVASVYDFEAGGDAYLFSVQYSYLF